MIPTKLFLTKRILIKRIAPYHDENADTLLTQKAAASPIF